jgi:hypothetical protein
MLLIKTIKTMCNTNPDIITEGNIWVLRPKYHGLKLAENQKENSKRKIAKGK